MLMGDASRAREDGQQSVRAGQGTCACDLVQCKVIAIESAQQKKDHIVLSAICCLTHKDSDCAGTWMNNY